MLMRPGTYLSKRRQAAGLAIEDVAARVACDPPAGERDRVAWLRNIERDIAPATLDVCTALLKVFRFDPTVLDRLIDLHSPFPLHAEAPAICTDCACSDRDACDVDGVIGCHWALPDLCSSCSARRERAA